MRFAYGATRWVIFTDQYAIKIARFRPIRPFIRLVDAMLKSEVKQGLRKHHTNPILATIKYLLAGVVANRNEYRLYRRHPSRQLAPTLFTIGYAVNIQIRGEPATQADVHLSKLFSLLRDTEFAADVLQAKQFCLINGKTCLADYGTDGLEETLTNK